MIEPLITYEVNEMMENVIHIAVSFSHYDIIEFLLEQDSGEVLLRAKDMKGRTPIDLARQTKQQGILTLLLGHQQTLQAASAIVWTNK